MDTHTDANCPMLYAVAMDQITSNCYTHAGLSLITSVIVGILYDVRRSWCSVGNGVVTTY